MSLLEVTTSERAMSDLLCESLVQGLTAVFQIRDGLDKVVWQLLNSENRCSA